MNKAFQQTVSLQCSTYTAQGQAHLEHFLSLVAGFLQMTSLSIQVTVWSKSCHLLLEEILIYNNIFDRQ